MTRIHRSAIGLGVLALAAPAWAAGQFDGTYTGRQTTTMTNNSANCQHMDRDISLTVKDNRISRRWGPQNDTVAAEVKPDGTFYGATSASAGGMGRTRTREYILRGRISGATLEAELGSSLCAVRMVLTRKP